MAASVKYAYLHYCIFGVDLRVLWPAESPDGAEPIITHQLVVSCPPPSLLEGGARFEVRGIVERGALTRTRRHQIAKRRAELGAWRKTAQPRDGKRRVPQKPATQKQYIDTIDTNSID